MGRTSQNNSGEGMRATEIIPQTRSIEHPRCECGARMWLARVEPDKVGHDRRTFECPRCQNEQVEVVKYR